MLHRVTRETHKRASHFRHIWEDKLGSVFWAVRLGGSGWKVEWRILCKSIPLKMKIYSSIYLCETCTFKPKPCYGCDGLWDRAGPLTLTVASDALNKPFSWLMTGASTRSPPWSLWVSLDWFLIGPKCGQTLKGTEFMLLSSPSSIACRESPSAW